MIWMVRSYIHWMIYVMVSMKHWSDMDYRAEILIRSEEISDMASVMRLKAVSRKEQMYEVHCNDNTRPYEGIVELLQSLKEEGIRCAVVSNKADYAVKALSDIHFRGLMEASVGEMEGIARKPAPDEVDEVLRLIGVDRKKAVYIGDSEVDIETARNAGMDCIAVSWGYRDRWMLEVSGAKVIADNVEQLKHLLLES